MQRQDGDLARAQRRTVLRNGGMQESVAKFCQTQTCSQFLFVFLCLQARRENSPEPDLTTSQ